MSAEWIRQRRAEARAAGMCISCRGRKPQPGKATCDVCLESHSRSASKMRGIRSGKTWCLDCQAYGFHRDGCKA
jgi:hypothetical protein